MQKSQFSVKAIFVATAIIAVSLAIPGVVFSMGATGASVAICVLLVGAIMDSVRTTEKSERKLIVPYVAGLFVGLLCCVFWAGMLVAAIAHHLAR